MPDLNLELHTVELTPKDFDRAAELLAAAFYDNPSHVYIFTNQNQRLKLLKWGLKANLKLNLAPPKPIGNSFALVEADKPPGIRQIKAMAFWHPPEHSQSDLMHKIKSGWLIAPFKFGSDYRRLMEVMSEIEKIKEKVLGRDRAWYLNNMVVTEELRGTGIGTKVLKHQLETVVEPSGFPAILMTQKKANVRFYQRLGFKVATESIVGSGKYAFTNWCMMRQIA